MDGFTYIYISLMAQLACKIGDVKKLAPKVNTNNINDDDDTGGFLVE